MCTRTGVAGVILLLAVLLGCAGPKESTTPAGRGAPWLPPGVVLPEEAPPAKEVADALAPKVAAVVAKAKRGQYFMAAAGFGSDRHAAALLLLEAADEFPARNAKGTESPRGDLVGFVASLEEAHLAAIAPRTRGRSSSARLAAGLVRLLQDKCSDVRIEAVKALWELFSPGALAAYAPELRRAFEADRDSTGLLGLCALVPATPAQEHREWLTRMAAPGGAADESLDPVRARLGDAQAEARVWQRFGKEPRGSDEYLDSLAVAGTVGLQRLLVEGLASARTVRYTNGSREPFRDLCAEGLARMMRDNPAFPHPQARPASKADLDRMAKWAKSELGLAVTVNESARSELPIRAGCKPEDVPAKVKADIQFFAKNAGMPGMENYDRDCQRQAAKAFLAAVPGLPDAPWAAHVVDYAIFLVDRQLHYGTEVFRRASDGEATGALAKLLSDRRKRVRHQASRGLRWLFAPATLKPLLPELRAALEQRLKDPDVAVLKAYAYAAASEPEAETWLRQFVDRCGWPAADLDLVRARLGDAAAEERVWKDVAARLQTVPKDYDRHLFFTAGSVEEPLDDLAFVDTLSMRKRVAAALRDMTPITAITLSGSRRDSRPACWFYLHVLRRMNHDDPSYLYWHHVPWNFSASDPEFEFAEKWCREKLGVEYPKTPREPFKPEDWPSSPYTPEQAVEGK